PDVAFDLVAVTPRAKSESDMLESTKRAEEEAAAVMKSLASMGISANRVNMAAWTGPPTDLDEIRLYIPQQTTTPHAYRAGVATAASARSLPAPDCCNQTARSSVSLAGMSPRAEGEIMGRLNHLMALLALAFVFALVGRPAAAQVSDADQAAIRQVIEQQLQAFQHDDGAGAYAFASPSIQKQFVN